MSDRITSTIDGPVKEYEWSKREQIESSVA